MIEMNNSQGTLNNSQLESLTNLPVEKLSTVTLKKNMSQIMKELIDELPGLLISKKDLFFLCQKFETQKSDQTETLTETYLEDYFPLCKITGRSNI